MTDYAAARRARCNAREAVDNADAIAETRAACIPHAAQRLASELSAAEKQDARTWSTQHQEESA